MKWKNAKKWKNEAEAADVSAANNYAERLAAHEARQRKEDKAVAAKFAAARSADEIDIRIGPRGMERMRFAGFAVEWSYEQDAGVYTLRWRAAPAANKEKP